MYASKMELIEVNHGNAGILAKAGVKVAIQVDSWSETKWLPVHAGIMIREGMPEEEAWKAITINPAEIIGVADRMGTLEVGKDADLAIFDGYPLSNLSHCEKTIIDGTVVYSRPCSCGCGCNHK
jgi:imidazolonepropionase-like amidohydrolase